MGTYSIDGVPLDDPAGRWVLSQETRLPPIPAPVLTAVAIPGVHGSAPIPPSVRGPGSHTVALIVTDNGPDGRPTGDHQQLRANLATLAALVAPLGRLPVLRYEPTTDPATHREARVRLLAQVDAEMPDPYTATVVYPFDIPETFWRDVEPLTFAAVGSEWEASPWETVGNTGSVTDPIFVIEGDLGGGVRITDIPTGRWVEWAGTIGRNDGSLRLDPANLAAYETVYPNSWTVRPGDVNVSSGLTFGPGGFDLTPTADNHLAWQVVRFGSDPGNNRVRLRRAYL